MQHRRRRLIFLELVSQSQRGALLSFKEMVSASAASSASALACLDVPPRSRKDLKPRASHPLEPVLGLLSTWASRDGGGCGISLGDFYSWRWEGDSCMAARLTQCW